MPVLYDSAAQRLHFNSGTRRLISDKHRAHMTLMATSFIIRTDGHLINDSRTLNTPDGHRILTFIIHAQYWCAQEYAEEEARYRKLRSHAYMQQYHAFIKRRMHEQRHRKGAHASRRRTHGSEGGPPTRYVQ